MKALYKYPQRAFPYADLVEENRRRGRDEPEYELLDTGVFAEDRYFDVVVEYAKAEPDDILIRITRDQPRPGRRAAAPAAHALVPQHLVLGPRPRADARAAAPADAAPSGRRRSAPSTATLGDVLAGLRRRARAAVHRERDQRRSGCGARRTARRTSRTASTTAVVHGRRRRGQSRADGHEGRGALPADDRAGRDRDRAAAPVGAAAARRRRSPTSTQSSPQRQARGRRLLRRASAPTGLTDDERRVQRQAFAGLLWSKQFYHYDVDDWLRRRPGRAAAAARARRHGRNARLARTSTTRDVISMPDKWEYPWFAAWDLAFHCIPLALVDPDFAKQPADPAAARVVHAPQRPAAGLRVGLRRRQPAGPRLGRLARLQDRAAADAARATAPSWSASSTSCC